MTLYKRLNELLKLLGETVPKKLKHEIEEISDGKYTVVDTARLREAQEIAETVETQAFVRCLKYFQDTTVADAVKFAHSSETPTSWKVSPVQAVNEVVRGLEELIAQCSPPNPLVQPASSAPKG